MFVRSVWVRDVKNMKWSGGGADHCDFAYLALYSDASVVLLEGRDKAGDDGDGGHGGDDVVSRALLLAWPVLEIALSTLSNAVRG
ncbi:hypothetical protein IAQ61_009367 [Plenodomus lingam]|uniref:Predicted protein n=1 Tax=Leptosphaeria maculans (strain JN3 / isolate v23.1.3 / race Av1-4-5-6-7-8) TaxID=985895 RepID=E4ZTX1_LEPMJ|nr:predicted protein [Plenodomus lingam JN3]KAH9863090.1 hypothetical protein IAQ61_009367 [Plenodomus lingam]CBX94681.1 predicted protein [Plenodomus lingam JN3]